MCWLATAGDLSPFKTLTVDVQDESTVLQAAKELKGIPIDLLINNADIYTGGDSMASTIKEIEVGGERQQEITSKTALHMVNRTMANELKRENIAAFLLDPGMVYTNMPLSSYESEGVKVVAEMANLIGKATMTDTGKLMDHNGTVLPW
ncbi:hypothetical protein F441_02275 [Phytophthora nicotianae CJ01A1]|nr:hypothetical protein F441_02275 [Phytophthora nicotianae CJ01A1]